MSGLMQHIQLPGNITNGKFSWIPVPERPTNGSVPISTSTMDPFWYVPPDQFAGLVWTNTSMLENSQEKLENVNENLFFWVVVAVYSTCVNMVISLLCHLSKCLVMPKPPKMTTQVRLDQQNSGVRRTYYRIPFLNWIMSKAVSRDSGKSSWQCTVRTNCCVYQAVYTCGACHLKRPRSQSSLDYVIRTFDPRGATALEFTGLEKLDSSEAANVKREFELDQPASSLLQVPSRSANRITTKRQNVPILPRVALFFVHLLAVLDIIQVICDYIFPFILRSPQVENMIPSRMRYHLDCHLRIMISMPTRFVVEWTLVVYGVERLITTIRRKPLFRAYPKRVTDHVELNALKVKIGMSLFIVIMFAACSNYFIIVGQPTALIDATGRKYRRLIVSCNIRKEFQQLNTRVLTYVKLFLFTCIPQLITLVCLTSIAFIWSLHRIFFCQTARAHPQTDLSSVQIKLWYSVLVIDEIMRQTLEGLRNPGVHMTCDKNPVDLQYADDIVLVFEGEEKAPFIGHRFCGKAYSVQVAPFGSSWTNEARKTGLQTVFRPELTGAHMSSTGPAQNCSCIVLNYEEAACEIRGVNGTYRRLRPLFNYTWHRPATWLQISSWTLNTGSDTGNNEQ
ncbi:hypothetical protein CLF_104615 [Clonorchis sinensis]|uniref:Uncharacterized protein n=1 Tax=Clonorchis sinensis TaxID=79923 RepID=G7YNW9_CLOSI|nr:hypothetical protein CLF_104615 [Clonorchis sinensis]